MSENWNASTGDRASDELDLSEESLTNEPHEIRGLGEREGLPASYRMRADGHYLDQLTASSSGQPVRLIPVAQIECQKVLPPAELRPLVDSIKEMGIVHPLLVRRQHSRYVVIAGHKRLMAAQTLRLAAVPCLVHDVNEGDAAALQAADNITLASASGVVRARPDTGASHGLLGVHVNAIRRCAEVSGSGAAGLARSSMTLLQAHAWRADRLLGALDLIADHPAPNCGERPLGAVVEEVIAGFRSEAELSRMTIRPDYSDAWSLCDFNAVELSFGLSAALLAVLPILDNVDRASVAVRAAASGGVLALHVTQNSVAVSKALVAHFFDEDESVGRPGGYTATIGALAARAFAERHGGKATFEAIDRGSRLTILLNRPV